MVNECLEAGCKPRSSTLQSVMSTHSGSTAASVLVDPEAGEDRDQGDHTLAAAVRVFHEIFGPGN